VDNLTHTLLGAALARTPLGRLSPYATPALLIGANLPDLDAVVRLWQGREGYLVHHRGITHAVPGVVAQALLLAAGLRWLERRRERRSGRPAGSWAGAATLAAVSLGSHPLLDLLNIYGLRPWLPFDPRWIYGDIAFIVDPWLWLALGAAVLLTGPRTRAGTLAWGLVFALAAAAVAAAASGGLVAWTAAGAWFAGLAGLVAARISGWRPRRPRTALKPPGEVRNIEILKEGDTWLLLSWDKPDEGGEVTAYHIQRREPRGEWEEVATSIDRIELLRDQPRGLELDFRVLATNRAGTGGPSATVTAVL